MPAQDQNNGIRREPTVPLLTQDFPIPGLTEGQSMTPCIGMEAARTRTGEVIISEVDYTKVLDIQFSAQVPLSACAPHGPGEESYGHLLPHLYFRLVDDGGRTEAGLRGIRLLGFDAYSQPDNCDTTC
jgi:hypothetical protein